MRTTLLSLVAALLPTALPAQVEPFYATVRSTVGCDVLVLEDGRRVRLQGVSLPTMVVRPRAFARDTRRWLKERVIGERMWFEPAPDALAADRTKSELLAIVRFLSEGASIQRDMIAAGRAILSYRTASANGIEELSKAAIHAQDRNKGWFRATDARPRVVRVPYLNGAVIGLHERDCNYSYEREVDELAALGFRTVSLIFATFIADANANKIDRHHARTVPDRRLIGAIRRARERHGMQVMLLPVVLLLDAGDDDWRGTLAPTDETRFWLDYDRTLSHYLDIAEATGVEMVSVGSELGSLEDRTETWQRLIVNARGRFSGLLTYSANWDHVHVPKFFDGLDAVGMTAYFSLTDTEDPTHADLVEGWDRVASSLRVALARIGRPVFFTELGYASQNGINTNPWNYFIAPEAIDVVEQLMCFESALECLPKLDFLSGAFWFEFALDGGRGDIGYTPRGKPAIEAWRKWAALRVDRPIRALGRR